jgi:hypothetical protein
MEINPTCAPLILAGFAPLVKQRARLGGFNAFSCGWGGGGEGEYAAGPAWSATFRCWGGTSSLHPPAASASSPGKRVGGGRRPQPPTEVPVSRTMALSRSSANLRQLRASTGSAESSTPGKTTVRFAGVGASSDDAYHTLGATAPAAGAAPDPWSLTGRTDVLSTPAGGPEFAGTAGGRSVSGSRRRRGGDNQGSAGAGTSFSFSGSSSRLRPPVIAWPSRTFVAEELPTLAATQIMAVRIDRRGAPTGLPAGTPGASTVALKAKTRGVTLGGWRTGVTAVKFSSAWHVCCYVACTSVPA